MERLEEIKQLLKLYKVNCFNLYLFGDDTEVEEETLISLKNIEERILELAK